MAEINRSLAACTRCRKLKVKCAGPATVPCPRCDVAGKECIFLQPRAVLRASIPVNSDQSRSSEQLDRIEALEKQVADLTRESNDEFQRLREVVESLKKGAAIPSSQQISMSNEILPALEQTTSRSKHQSVFNSNESVTIVGSVCSSVSTPRFEESSLVAKGILSERQCVELFEFFHQNCNDTIAFFDTISASKNTILQNPLLLASICTVGARASHSNLYEICRSEAESLIQQTMSGPVPDLLSLRGAIIYATWHHANRVWGHAVSLAYELGLHTAALSLITPAAMQDAETVEKARTWLSLCLVDLINNLNAPFLISNIQSYVKLGVLLCSSKYFRTVDYRIKAYLEIFGTAAEAKESISEEMMQANPLTKKTKELFSTFNSKVDSVFHNICNNVDPLYQTFSRPQDRNRMLIPYSFVRMYINGISLHGLSSSHVSLDSAHIELIQTAIKAGMMLLSVALQSLNFKKSLQHSIDYSGAILLLATNFLYKAVFVAHQYIDVSSIVDTFHRIIALFREAGAPIQAQSLEKMLMNISKFGQNSASPGFSNDAPRAEGVLFDIVGNVGDFVSDPTWHQNFPLCDGF